MRILRGTLAAARIDALAARASQITAKESEVKRIVTAVRRRGDAALCAYARKWDRLSNQPLRVSSAEMRQSFRAMPRDLMARVKLAEANIRDFAERQKP